MYLFTQLHGAAMPQTSPHRTVALSSFVYQAPVTVAPDTPLSEVLAIMEQRKISCVLAVDDLQRPTGIFTEQDVVRLLVPGPDEQQTAQTMADVMHQPVFSMPATADYRDAYLEMVSRRFRHLAVVDQAGQLAGVVSEGDFMHHMGFEVPVHPPPQGQVRRKQRDASECARAQARAEIVLPAKCAWLRPRTQKWTCPAWCKSARWT